MARQDKLDFLAELNVLRQVRTGPRLLNGDFNMIYRTCNKSNNRLNRRLMGQFRRFLEEAAMKEIHLKATSSHGAMSEPIPP
jgi:endonuclease/exonuclease/phosphatase family metal-dependent hydrolase